MLTLQTRLYKCAHIYLGRCGPQPVTDLRSVGLLRSLPDLTNASDCECVKRCSKPSNALPKLQHTRKPSPSGGQQRLQIKSRSLDSQTPDAEDKPELGEPEKVKLELPKNIITIGAPTLTKQQPEDAVVGKTLGMRKSISLQEGTYRRVQVNFLGPKLKKNSTINFSLEFFEI